MNDREMREPLFDYLEDFYGKIRILEEKNAGSSRADVIGVVDGELIGFEIKSDRDSYTRLKTQTADYDAFCDFNYLVIGASHQKHAHEHLPPHWGILIVRETPEGVLVEMDQLPARNEHVRLGNQLSFLWRPELEQLLAENDLPLYRGRSKAFVQAKLLERVEESILKRQITDLLFERDYEQLLGEIGRVRRENYEKRLLTGTAGRKTLRIRRKRIRRRKQIKKQAGV